VAVNAVHNRHVPDVSFLLFFPGHPKTHIGRRNRVKKAINRPLRQAWGMNSSLNREAILLAEDLMRKNSRCTVDRAGALRELTGVMVQDQIRNKELFRQERIP
jgi:hypothetical protein